MTQSIMTKKSTKSQSHSLRFKNRMIGFVIKHRQPEAAALAIELAQYVLQQDFTAVFAGASARGSKRSKSKSSSISAI
jgi:hypothetical protein